MQSIEDAMELHPSYPLHGCRPAAAALPLRHWRRTKQNASATRLPIMAFRTPKKRIQGAGARAALSPLVSTAKSFVTRAPYYVSVQRDCEFFDLEMCSTLCYIDYSSLSVPSHRSMSQSRTRSLENTDYNSHSRETTNIKAILSIQQERWQIVCQAPHSSIQQKYLPSPKPSITTPSPHSLAHTSPLNAPPPSAAP